MRLLKHPVLIPALFVLAGALYLLGPFVAAWLEVVAPHAARALTFLAGRDAVGILFGVAALLYVAYIVSVARSPHTPKERTVALLPLMIVALLWVATGPLQRSVYGQPLESATVAGGWTRMMLAGGPAAVQAEALDLLASPEESSVRTMPPSDVPPSLRRLGDTVSVQRDYGLVLVSMKPVVAGGNEFGYMIHSGRTPLSIPWFFQFSSNLRVWKIAEGIYFFEQ